MKPLSNAPTGSNLGHKTTLKGINIPYTSPDFSAVAVHNLIGKLLMVVHAVEHMSYIKQIGGGRPITPNLSHNLNIGLYEVGENVVDTYMRNDSPSHLNTNVKIKHTPNGRVDVTIYIIDASGTTIYTQQLSGDILLISEDSQQIAYLENDLTSFDYNDIQSALRCMIEFMFLKHQQAKVKTYAKKDKLTNPVVWMDIDFSYQLYSPAIEIEDHMKPTSDDRVKLKIDYFRGDWTHIRVTITLFDSLGDRETVKISGDMELCDL